MDARTTRCAIAALLAGALLAAACSGGRDSRAGDHPAEGQAASRSPGTRGTSDLVYERELDGNRDLYVIPAGGGIPRRLTTHPGIDGLPRWTVDGSAVVFTSDRAGNWQLWSVPAEGGDAARVRANPHREWQADESPDGRTLAFLSNQAGPEGLWLLDRASGAARERLHHARRSVLGNPHWSRDGKRIVFSSNWKSGHQIYVVEVDGGEERRISPGGGCEPRFSPDGRRVAYVGRRPDRENSRILEHDLATGDERVLVDWPGLNYDPVYSPDGSEIAFASTVAGKGYEVYRQGLADGKASRVTFDGGDARYPDYRARVR
jgi:Tol biopolymer transport system component